jgi:hypothetical protein
MDIAIHYALDKIEVADILIFGQGRGQIIMNAFLSQNILLSTTYSPEAVWFLARSGARFTVHEEHCSR